MNRLLLSLFLAVSASFALWASLDRTYQYDAFASKETQSSVEVTEAQSAELLASRKKSDMIAYATIGGVFALVIALAEARKLSFLIAIAPVLGVFGGALGSVIGHWQDTQMRLDGNQVLYWFARWAAILLPIGAACGVAAQFSSRTRGANGIVGGIVGAALSALIYGTLSGSVTPNESRQDIFPIHSSNRLLVILLTGISVAIVVHLQLKSKSSRAEENKEKLSNP